MAEIAGIARTLSSPDLPDASQAEGKRPCLTSAHAHSRSPEIHGLQIDETLDSPRQCYSESVWTMPDGLVSLFHIRLAADLVVAFASLAAGT